MFVCILNWQKTLPNALTLWRKLIQCSDWITAGWSTNRGFSFRQTFLFIFYKKPTDRFWAVPKLLLNMCVFVCVFVGGGSYFTPGLSHTRQDDHWHSCSEKNAWSYTPAPSYVLVTGRNTWYVTYFNVTGSLYSVVLGWNYATVG